MMRSILSSPHHPSSDARGIRRGFTLIELLVAISIITILISLLTVAVFSSIERARELEVAAEIVSIDKAISDFKQQFGSAPPSSVTLYETAADWATDASGSESKLKSVFGRDLDLSVAYDFNGDGDTTDTFVLNGAECLVFFLGGPLKDNFPAGFSKNPSQPFTTTSENRWGPFYEFDRTKLFSDASSNWLMLVDPVSNPSRGYYYIHSDEYNDPANALAGSGKASPYKQTASAFYNSQSHQIIAAGTDGEFGTGDLYPSDDLPEADRDNMTNFHKGALKP